MNALHMLKKYASRKTLAAGVESTARRATAESSRRDRLALQASRAGACGRAVKRDVEDQATQRAFVKQELASAKGMQFFTSELPGHALIEALMELKYEIEVRGGDNAPEHIALMRQTLGSVVRATNAVVPKIPQWFIPSYGLDFPDWYFGSGTWGTVHRGTWRARPVVITKLLMWSEHLQRSSAKNLKIWSQLTHPHILKLYGGNVSISVYFVKTRRWELSRLLS